MHMGSYYVPTTMYYTTSYSVGYLHNNCCLCATPMFYNCSTSIAFSSSFFFALLSYIRIVVQYARPSFVLLVLTRTTHTCYEQVKLYFTPELKGYYSRVHVALTE